MTRFYIDASGLMRWAEGQTASPTADQATAASRVEEIILDDDSTVQISEMTFVEFHDTVLRYRNSGRQEWTDEWLRRVQTQLMEWIESGRLAVRPPDPRALDVAMSYISMAREAGRSLKAGDAIHLNYAIEWAHEASEQVTLVTGDQGFERFIQVFPAASRFITLEMVVVTQEPMPGTMT